jgi:hypothetical protein
MLVVFWVVVLSGTSVLEEYTASIFRASAHLQVTNSEDHHQRFHMFFVLLYISLALMVIANTNLLLES